MSTARHRCNISSKGAVLPGCTDAEMGLPNLLHALAKYNEYDKERVWNITWRLRINTIIIIQLLIIIAT